MYTVSHYIGGKRQSNQQQNKHSIFNPASGQVCGEVEYATKQEVDAACASAKAAFTEWSQTSAVKRARILFQFKHLLEKYTDILSELVTTEHGKTLADARGSILRGIELTEHLCGIANQIKGSYSENVSQGIDCYTVRQPLGVCAGVSPFNFPVMVPIWMMIPAIACGNTFILKPSEHDPSAPLRLAELLSEAGLPDGVVNVVNGDKTVVDMLLTHPDIAAMTAVASTPVAEHIYKTAINHGKRAHTFGGAKNHAVVMPDADIEQAAEALAGAGFGSAGERCMAISVIVAVGDQVADQLIAAMRPKIDSLRIGPGDTDVDIGPLISAPHRQSVLNYVQQGVNEGAELVVDGREITIKGAEQGYFFGPCLFDHVKASMRIYQEEIFGPVLCVVRVKDFDQALALVNQHQFGNGTAIFTRDGDTARTYASRVQVGMVGVNIPIPVPIAHHPFGGWKRSMFGDVDMHGDQAMQFYSKLKTVTTRWPKGLRGAAEYSMPTHQ